MADEALDDAGQGLYQYVLLAAAYDGGACGLVGLGGAGYDAYQGIALRTLHGRERQGVGDAAVNERDALVVDGGEDEGHGDGGTYGPMQAAPGEAVLAVTVEVGSDGRVGQGQVLYVDVGYDVQHLAHDAVTLDESGPGQGEVHQPQYAAQVEGAQEVLARVQSPGCVGSTYQCSHRAAGYGCYLEPLPQYFLDGTYVGYAACASGGEHEGGLPSGRGRRVGLQGGFHGGMYRGRLHGLDRVMAGLCTAACRGWSRSGICPGRRCR